MAAGDVMLDASGNVIIDGTGNVMLSDGIGDDCCCDECTCDESLGSYTVTIDVTGCDEPVIAECSEFDGVVVVENIAEDLCTFAGSELCVGSDAVSFTLELLTPCTWYLTITYPGATVIFRGTREKADGIVGIYTQIEGCSASASVA